MANGGVERLVLAEFAPYPDMFAKCTAEVVAGCTVSTCTGKTRGAITMGAAVEPGAVTAASTSLGGELPITMTAGYGRIVQAGVFADDELVRLKTAGSSELPAIDETVRVPADLQGFTVDGCQTPDATTTCPLPSAGATLRWTGAKRALVYVSLAPQLDTADQTFASCQYAGDPGLGRLPREVVARLASQHALTMRVALYDAAARVHAGAKHAVAVYGTRWIAQRPIGLSAQ